MVKKKFRDLVSLNLLIGDLRQAWRQLCKAPAFTTTVALVLAAGFGVSVAIFSIVRTVVLSPLPFKEPGRLVQVVSRWPRAGAQNDWTAPLGDAVDWKTSVPAFQDVAMYRYDLVNVTGNGSAESLYGLRVTANLLSMLGVRPRIGNWFSSEHDRPGSAHVILLSDDLWRRRFHSYPGVIGKTITMDDETYAVSGVMPTGFNFPLRLGTTAQLPTDQMQFWVPLIIDPAKEQHGEPNAGVIAKLKPGIELREAQAQLENACAMLEREYPITNRDLSARLSSLRQQTIRPVNQPLLALLAATALTLLMTCANIASLLLARGESRASELAVRMAIGGSAWRVARLPTLQGLLLCCLGCLLGVPVAIASMRLLLHLAPVDVPRLANARIDLTAMLFAAALALGCGVLVGGINALQVLRRSPREVLSDASRSSAGGTRTRLRSSLVAGQIALAVILISGAGLMLRTFVNLRSTDIGYRADHVYYGVTVLPPLRYPHFEDRQLFFRRVVDRLRSSPGVEFASVSTGFPLVGQYDSAKAQSKSMAAGNADDSGISADLNAVSSGYFEAMGVRLIHGRFINERDTAASPKVAVIDRSLAEALWPGENPLGQLVNTDDPAKPVWRQVVGVVAPMHNRWLDSGRPGVLLPLDQTTGYVNFVVVKTSGGLEETSLLLRDTVSGVDANQGVFFIQSFPDLISGAIAVRRFLFMLLAFFGGAALVLSTLGIYGLISFIAASRTREMGIRVALGATRGSIGKLVVSQGVRLALLGEAIGLLASAALSRLLSSLLYGVRSFDAETILFTIAVLGMTTTIAALIPAWRSTRVEPMMALRRE